MSSLKELKGLRESVLAEEKAKTQALLQNLPDPIHSFEPEEANVPEDVDQPVESSDEFDTAPVFSPPPVQPAIVRPSPSRPSAPPAARAKTGKEPALIIPLTPKIQERLQKHVEDARWSSAELVMEIIRVTLHQGYPAIQFEDQLIANPGTYRTYERNPMEALLRIVSGQGIFNVSVTSENPDYQHWLSYFADQKAPDPDKSAQQICLFSLQTYLESMEDFRPHGWVKVISPASFSLAPAS